MTAVRFLLSFQLSSWMWWRSIRINTLRTLPTVNFVLVDLQMTGVYATDRQALMHTESNYPVSLLSLLQNCCETTTEQRSSPPQLLRPHRHLRHWCVTLYLHLKPGHARLNYKCPTFSPGIRSCYSHQVCALSCFYSRDYSFRLILASSCAPYHWPFWHSTHFGNGRIKWSDVRYFLRKTWRSPATSHC